jgi:quercetin dioxygenase-like cupin family protein
VVGTSRVSNPAGGASPVGTGNEVGPVVMAGSSVTGSAGRLAERAPDGIARTCDARRPASWERGAEIRPDDWESTMSTDATTPVTRPGDALAGALRRTELQHDASSIPGREIVQVLTEIPAGVSSGWHMHPGEEVGYILEGTVQMDIEGRATLTLQAGDPFLMPPRTPHNATDLGPDTGRMLSTYIVETDAPLATFTR